MPAAVTEADVRIGAALRDMRTARGVPLRVLAVHTRISSAMISKYETGRNPIPAVRMLQLVEALGGDLQYVAKSARCFA